MVGFQAQLTGEDFVTLPDQAPIEFNSVLNSTSSAISLVDGTTFVLNEVGNYLINYEIISDGSEVAPRPVYALVPSVGPSILVSPPVNIEQITATVLLNVTMAPTQFQIVNVTGNNVFINNNPVGANIVVTHIE